MDLVFSSLTLATGQNHLGAPLKNIDVQTPPQPIRLESMRAGSRRQQGDFHIQPGLKTALDDSAQQK